MVMAVLMVITIDSPIKSATIEEPMANEMWWALLKIKIGAVLVRLICVVGVGMIVLATAFSVDDHKVLNPVRSFPQQFKSQLKS